MSLAEDFLNLLFPRSCGGCNAELASGELSICTNCMLALPRTHYWEHSDNPVARMFWGRVKIENAATLFHFQKGGRLQQLMHNLKYKNMNEIGIELGKELGHQLINTPFSECEVLVPVPLHKSRLKKRGYNQSSEIAKGLAEILKLEIDTTSVYRTIATATQTMKNRYDRWSNVENIFEISKNETLANKHVLLVDDVLTTGATLEACASKILEIPETKVSIVALACADLM